MGLSGLELLSGAIALVIILYYYLTSTFDFWKSRGVRGPKPVIFFGTVWDIIVSRESVGTYCRKYYELYRDDPMVGIYLSREPVLILNDLDLIKTILIKDFNIFVDRGLKMDEKHDPLSCSLFSIEEKRWRPLRSKLSSMFTSGRLRDMFYLLKQCGNQLDTYMDAIDGMCVDIRDVTAKFSTDVIGVCAFGIQANALEDDNSVFRQMGRRIFTPTARAIVRFKLQQYWPAVNKIFGRFLSDRVLTDFFISITRDTMEYRRSNNLVRHDFIDLLRKIKEESNKDDIELTIPLMAAQLFVFFIGGFETSSSTMSNCLLELAINHHIQDKVREEINEELEKTGGEVTYEGIQNLEYLDKVMKETLRKYPPLPMILRESNAPYTFPGTNVTIPARTKVWLPIYGIQRDERHFPDPNGFDPERFTEEAMRNRHPMTFLSFGDGPRNCVGARFGNMQTKVGLVKILQRFMVDVCDKTEKDYDVDRHNFLLTPKNGTILKVAKIPEKKL